MDRGPGADRVWLNVPYEEKDEAKAAGARWDGERGRWWAPEGSAASGDGRWVPLVPGWPDPLPGEDRSFAPGLSIDLVPSSAWFTNVRTAVTRTTWEKLRLYAFERADRCCEGCGSWEHPASGRALELHERFEFDVATRTQSLRRLVALCERCHAVAHFDRTVSQGFEREAFAHLLRVADMTAAEATACLDDARTVAEVRGRYEWELDLSILTRAGITVRASIPAEYRPGEAARRLETGQP
jgi:hypothetical protein